MISAPRPGHPALLHGLGRRRGSAEQLGAAPGRVAPELGALGRLAQPRVLGFARTPDEAAGKPSAARAVAERMGAAMHGIPTDPEALEDGLMQHLSALLAAEAPAADHLAIITRAIEDRCADPAQSHLSMAEIAQRTGFVSPAQFSRAVRGRFGATPLRLRRGLLQS